MPIVPPNPISYTDSQETEVSTAITNLQNGIDAIALPDVDREEVGTMQVVGNIRYPYVKRTIELHTANFPGIVPPYLPRTDAQANLRTIDFLAAVKAQLYKMIETISEASMIAENNAYLFMREAYDQAKRAEKAGTIPGVHSVITDLEPLFSQGAKEENLPPEPGE